MLIIKIIENNTMYNIQELHLSSLLPTIFNSSTQFHYTLPQVYQLFFSTLTIFIIQILTNIIWFITLILTITGLPNISHTSLWIHCLHSHQHLSSFQPCLLLETLAPNQHLHFHVSCHFMCLVSLVFEIRLNTLTFRLFIISGTHIFAYGSLILLQLPLNLLV